MSTETSPHHRHHPERRICRKRLSLTGRLFTAPGSETLQLLMARFNTFSKVFRAAATPQRRSPDQVMRT